MSLTLKLFKSLNRPRFAYAVRACTLNTPKHVFDEPTTSQFHKNEKDLIFAEDPDVFGNIARKIAREPLIEDEGDKKESEFLENKVMQTHKFTIKQYADLIKQYIKHKRLKEAINVLEERMLTVDKVKPENYIYNILIGGCADVGYTQKAFKLFNDMKRRALKPTGDTYTCLFTACANSPWPKDGLKRALQLRELMNEKAIEPNLTNYNAMIKAFGRCGDLKTAFQIVDEMISQKIKIRVHTFNHLLVACITDKEHGLRHALIVWRKMLKMREKPNIYSFNLMLKCVRECNLGGKEDIAELLESMQDNLQIATIKETKYLESVNTSIKPNHITIKVNFIDRNQSEQHDNVEPNNANKELVSINTEEPTLTVVEKRDIQTEKKLQRMPNLLAQAPEMSQVLSLRDIKTVQEKFAIIGGQEDILREMAVYNVKPDIKTFTQMLLVLDETREAELKLIDTMKDANINADIDFYNMLIKKRCLRKDYIGAYEVMTMIEEEDKLRKKKYHPFKKDVRIKPNIMTYGVLAMACRTKEECDKLLHEMQEKKLKVNIEILGALLKHAIVKSEFSRIMEILKMIQNENLKVNSILLGNLETFNETCCKIIDKGEKRNKVSEVFSKSFKSYLKFYNNWIKDMGADKALKEHPWKQFNEVQPDTVQRQNLDIKEPKRFYKSKRKSFLRYAAPI